MTYYYYSKRDIHKDIGKLVTHWMQCINKKGSMLAITNCCIPRFLRELNMYELPLPQCMVLPQYTIIPLSKHKNTLHKYLLEIMLSLMFCSAGESKRL